MFQGLFTWENLGAACVAILGVMGTAAIYQWIGHPKIIWIAVACLIGLEIYFAHQFISFLEGGQSEKATSPTSQPSATSPSDSAGRPSAPSPSANLPTRQNASREWLSVEPSRLAEVWKNYTELQIKPLIEPHLGKWMRISGHVEEVTKTSIIDGHDLLLSLAYDPTRCYGVTILFRNEWEGRLMALRKGEAVSLIGKIHSIFKDWFWITDSELAIEPIARPQLAIDFVREIIEKIPPECIPTNGNWSDSAIARADSAISGYLCETLTLHVKVEKAEVDHSHERHDGKTRIQARIPRDEKTNLATLFWAYFEGVDEQTKRFILGHRPGVQIKFTGTVERADLSDGRLNIDLHRCVVVHPVKST